MEHYYEIQVAAIVNQERAKAGLGALALDANISFVARVKSLDMRDNHYFSHQSPQYGSTFNILSQCGIAFSLAGENIAKGQRTPQVVMKDWMNSEEHRKNILEPSFKQLGVGFACDAYGNTYWTQLFCV